MKFVLLWVGSNDELSKTYLYQFSIQMIFFCMYRIETPLAGLMLTSHKELAIVLHSETNGKRSISHVSFIHEMFACLLESLVGDLRVYPFVSCFERL